MHVAFVHIKKKERKKEQKEIEQRLAKTGLSTYFMAASY
jgi:hypothetical protein